MPSRSKPPLPDEENPEWSRTDFARSVPLSGLPKTLQEKLKKHTRGPQVGPTKVAISIRLSKDVVEELRETGTGWQSRVDDALRSWLKSQARTARGRS